MENRTSSVPPRDSQAPEQPRRRSWPPAKPMEPDRLAHSQLVLLETLVRVGENLEAKRGSVTVLGKEFHASEGVFSPKFSLEDTSIFAQNIPVTPGERMLEIGTGTGILSIFCCYRGASEIVAVDINWRAVWNAKANVELHNMGSRISVRTGNVYVPAVKKDEKFDTIFWNVPFVFAKSEDVSAILRRLGAEADSNPEMRAILERLPGDLRHFDLEKDRGSTNLWAAYIDRDYKSIRKFIRGAQRRLRENGKLLVCFSSTYGEMELLYQLAEESRMDSRIIFERENSRGVMLEIIEMRPRTYLPEKQPSGAPAESSPVLDGSPSQAGDAASEVPAQGPAPPAAE